MTTITGTPIPARRASDRPISAPRRAVTRTLETANALESLIVFTLFAAAFIAIGIHVVVDLHVVYSDGQSRLTHAYMVWWNRPAKLAAIGFVWPPMQTLSLLPFTVIKPLASSLVALPVFAGLCGGGVIAGLNRTLRRLEVHRGWRYPLLLAFAANPIFVDYASNGMAEILFLLLLTLGVDHFIAWQLEQGQRVRPLLMSGLYMALGFLARYELGMWIALMAVCVVWTAWRRGAKYNETEANALLFLAPVVYCAAVWSALSMLVIGGGPLSWVSAAGNQGQGAVLHASTGQIARDTLAITARISPMVFVIPALLIVVGIVRRRPFALLMAAMTLVGAVTTFVLVAHSPHIGLLQIRYNIRALPVALVAGGWLMRELPAGILRHLAGAVLLACLVAAVPLGYDTMMHYRYQYEEQAFMRALKTGKDQDGTRSIGGYVIGDRAEKAMASYIDDHVHAKKSVLVDDGSLPGVILTSGRPILFVTRVDHGDKRWLHVLAHPWGHVRYLLVATSSAGGSTDLIESHHPGADLGRFPGAHVVFRTPQSVLLQVDAHAPAGAPTPASAPTP